MACWRDGSPLAVNNITMKKINQSEPYPSIFHAEGKEKFDKSKATAFVSLRLSC